MLYLLTQSLKFLFWCLPLLSSSQRCYSKFSRLFRRYSFKMVRAYLDMVETVFYNCGSSLILSKAVRKLLFIVVWSKTTKCPKRTTFCSQVDRSTRFTRFVITWSLNWFENQWFAICFHALILMELYFLRACAIAMRACAIAHSKCLGFGLGFGVRARVRVRLPVTL